MSGPSPRPGPAAPGGQPGGAGRARHAGRVFNRAVAYGALITLTGAAYVFGVVRADSLLGLSTDWLAAPQIVAVGVIALVFQPARAKAERWADRLVYGKRKPAYDLLAEVSALAGASEPAAGALSSLARAVAQGVGTGAASVVLDLPGGTAAVYRWPAGDRPAAGAAERRIPISYRGEPVGALCLPGGAGGRLPRARRALLADICGGAGVILHNASLSVQLGQRLREARARSAELRASRWRIVAAQDSERRELERDLHDGAQPSLTAVRLTLGLASHKQRAADLPGVQRALGDLHEQITGALSRLRQTLRGLDPQITGLPGLAAALLEQAESLGTHPLLRIGDGAAGGTAGSGTAAPLDPVAATAVYYCCTEALQNAVKHAPGASIEVWADLDASGGRLCFSVTDTGPGFDVGTAPAGGGLQNMADRIGAAGGTVTVRSGPGEGTSVTGWVPASPAGQHRAAG